MDDQEKSLLNPNKKQIEDIKSKYPSICYECSRARRPASLKFRNEGYVGCTLLIEGEYYNDPFKGSVKEHLTDLNIAAYVIAEKMFTGWVNLSLNLFGDDERNDFRAGVMTNCQLMTVKCTRCKYFNFNDKFKKRMERKSNRAIKLAILEKERRVIDSV